MNYDESNEGRCPACGHLRALSSKDGTIPLHHPYGSEACEGTGRLPSWVAAK